MPANHRKSSSLQPTATMLAIAAVLAAPAFALLLPGAAHAQNQAKYMTDSTQVTPGGKIGCPAGRYENLNNNVGLMPCMENYAPVNGTPRKPEKDLGACGAGNVSWAINGNTCAGYIGSGAHGGSGSAVSSNGNTGNAQFRCTDGTWYGPLSGTCVPPTSCPTSQVTWEGEDGTCAGTLPKIFAGNSAWASGVSMVTNKRPGNSPDPSNSYSAQCQSNGQWKVSSKQCKVLPAGCGAQTVYWNQSLNWDTSAKGCYGPTTAAQNGQTVKVIDQNPSQETSDPGNYATWACLDGSWSATGGQCLEIQPDKNKPLTKTVPVYFPGYSVCNDGHCDEIRPAIFCGFVDMKELPNGHVVYADDVKAHQHWSIPGVVTPACRQAISYELSFGQSGFDCSQVGPFTNNQGWGGPDVYSEIYAVGLNSIPPGKLQSLNQVSLYAWCGSAGGP